MEILGAKLLEPEIFDYLDGDECIFEQAPLEKLAEEGQLMSYRHRGFLQCMDTMRELFRQFMSKLILEKTKQEQHNIYLDSRISFQEIDQYFFSGCACAFFQIAVDTYTDLRYDPTEWQ